MKKKEGEVRQKMVVVRLSKQEYEQLEAFRQKSLDQTLSAYLRKVALHKPVTVRTRNSSTDDFLRDMAGLQEELRTLTHHYGTAVERLQLLERIPEFRAWILEHKDLYSTLHHQVQTIESRVTQLYEQWLPK